MPVKISVVTTVFNGEAYFERAVPSILAQTLDDFEFLVVDDGSTDRTPGFLAELAARDPRVRVLSPGRVGFAKALNLAIAQAQGEYIARQDFDDLSYPERLELQAAFLDAHPGVGMVGGAYVVQDDNRGERYVRRPPQEHAALVRAMARYIPFAHTLVTFRRAAWEQVQGYPEVNNIVDLRMWVRFAAAGWELANLPEVVGEHWVHGSSFWHQNFKYHQRQKELAQVQASAVRELGLPVWMYLYPLARYFYGYLPNWVKRAARRGVGGSREEDLARTGR